MAEKSTSVCPSAGQNMLYLAADLCISPVTGNLSVVVPCSRQPGAS